MLKSERVQLYEWCQLNEHKRGAEHPAVKATQCDYEAIRQRLAKRYKFAGLRLVESNRDNKKILIYIK